MLHLVFERALPNRDPRLKIYRSGMLRVVDSLGGELTLNGFASNHSGTAPTAANVHDARAARLRALDKLTAQAQELKMGYK